MQATDKRRNRELAEAFADALQALGCTCDLPDGWDDSLYAKVIFAAETDDEWNGELRISDHQQADGGGWSESLGCRHGEADICILAKSGRGADLKFDENGKIIRVPLVRATFGADVPAAVRGAVQGVADRFATIYAARSQAAARASETRKQKRMAAINARIAAWHAEVKAELIRTDGIADIDIDRGMPEARVPAGVENRSKRIAAAKQRIDEACKRLFAARQQ